MASFNNHILYYKPTCPYCLRVLDYMKREGIECALRNTLEPGIAEELIAIGGKRQVPCLVIDGEALYESADIIAYMGKHAAESPHCPSRGSTLTCDFMQIA